MQKFREGGSVIQQADSCVASGKAIVYAYKCTRKTKVNCISKIYTRQYIFTYFYAQYVILIRVNVLRTVVNVAKLRQFENLRYLWISFHFISACFFLFESGHVEEPGAKVIEPIRLQAQFHWVQGLAAKQACAAIAELD